MKVNRLALLAFLLGVLPAGASAQMQQLSLKRDMPNVAWAGCPRPDGAPKTVTPAQQQEAERSASSATEASLLGDKTTALQLLTRAAVTDPTSRTIAYRLARALDEAERLPAALAAYCQYLALAPEAADAQEVRERTRVLGTPTGLAVPAEARQAFADGIASYDAGKLAEAEASFGKASEAVPTWNAPVFNRGLARMALAKRNDAEIDFRRYLELSPGSPDFNQVLTLIASFRQPDAPRVNTGGVFARGLIVPGLGQLTTGQSAKGAVYLGAAAAAVAVGVAVKRVAVECLSEPVNGVCPSDQIDRTSNERPYLIPAIGAYLALGLISAIDAARGVRKQNAATPESTRIGEQQQARSRAPYLAVPTVQVGLDGARVDLVRIRF
jgi:tetratricopeptide (TPR) repeat protein